MSADPELDLMFGELLSLIAGRACSPKVFREAEERRAVRDDGLRKLAAQRKQALAEAHRIAAGRRPMAFTARRLASAVMSGDRASADVLLSRPKSNAEWRELALILAAAATPERLASAVVPIAASPESQSSITRGDAAA